MVKQINQTTRLSTSYALLAMQAFEITALIPLHSLLIQKIQPSPFARRLLGLEFNPKLKNLFLKYKTLTSFILSSSK